MNDEARPEEPQPAAEQPSAETEQARALSREQVRELASVFVRTVGIKTEKGRIPVKYLLEQNPLELPTDKQDASGRSRGEAPSGADNPPVSNEDLTRAASLLDAFVFNTEDGPKSLREVYNQARGSKTEGNESHQ